MGAAISLEIPSGGFLADRPDTVGVSQEIPRLPLTPREIVRPMIWHFPGNIPEKIPRGKAPGPSTGKFHGHRGRRSRWAPKTPMGLYWVGVRANRGTSREFRGFYFPAGPGNISREMRHFTGNSMAPSHISWAGVCVRLGPFCTAYATGRSRGAVNLISRADGVVLRAVRRKMDIDRLRAYYVLGRHYPYRRPIISARPNIQNAAISRLCRLGEFPGCMGHRLSTGGTPPRQGRHKIPYAPSRATFQTRRET